MKNWPRSLDEPRMFLRKADVDVDDVVLRQLARRNFEEARTRTDAIASVVSSTFHESAVVEPLGRQGTFHLVHRAKLQSGLRLIIRSSLSDIFAVDEGLLVERL